MAKQSFIDAIYWDGSIEAAGIIESWSGGSVVYRDDELWTDRFNYPWRCVSKSQWLIKHIDGSIDAMGDQLFQRMFVLA